MKHLGSGTVERQQLHKCCFHNVPVGDLAPGNPRAHKQSHRLPTLELNSP